MKLVDLVWSKAPVLLIASVASGLAGGLGTVALFAFIIHLLPNPDLTLQAKGLFFAGLATLIILSKVFSLVAMNRIVSASVFSLRMEFMEGMLSAPLGAIESAGSSRLLTAITQDASTIAEAVPRIVVFLISVSTLAGLIGYLAWLSLEALMLVLCLLVVTALAFLQSRARTKARRARAAELWVNFLASSQTAVNGGKELRLGDGRFRRSFWQKYRDDMSNMRDVSIKGGLESARLIGECNLLFFSAVIFYLLTFDLQHSGAAAVGFGLALIYMMGPLESVVGAAYGINEANEALQRIERLMIRRDAAELDHGPYIAEPVAELGGSILELCAVEYNYPDTREFMLGPIDLLVRSGEILFIVGGNGSGKSTLGKVLTGLYPPSGGKISLDGDAVDLSMLRRQFAAVFSEFCLLDGVPGTFLESDETRSRMQRCVHRLALEGLVDFSDGALWLKPLSLGQRKRVAYLTAYVADRPFYLFDEWAADQDPTFKKTFYRELLPELRDAGKAVIVITHDVEFVDCADRTIRLAEGKLCATSGETFIVREAGA